MPRRTSHRNRPWARAPGTLRPGSTGPLRNHSVKILHIFDHSLPLQSGYTFRSMAILRAQRARGWQTVQLTTPRHGQSAKGPAEREDVDEFTFWRTPLPGGALARTPLWPFAEMRATVQRLETLARAERPDVLHAHSPSLNAHPAITVGRRLGIPVVYELRGLWEDAAVDHGTSRGGGLRYRLTRLHETLALRRAQQVTTISQGLLDEITQRGVPRSRVTTIPNAVDVKRFTPVSAPHAELRDKLGLAGHWVLGFCGSFYAYEGLDLLLRALPRVLQRIGHAKVLLVGGGPEEAALRQLAHELGVADHVVFTGRVPNKDVNNYYSLIDVLVFPRKRMRLTELVTPLKPLEAMAMGLPVAASDVGGHRELIRHEATGLLFRADDPEALAATVIALNGDTGLARRLKEAGLKFVSSERTWERSVAEYAHVYSAACAALAEAKPGVATEPRRG